MKTVKKIIISLMAVSLLMVGCGFYSEPVTVLAAGTLTATKSLTIIKGKKKTITVKGTFVKSKTFKSSKTNIATVSEKGVVTAKKAGNCKVTITVKYCKVKNAKKVLTKKLICKVTVKEVQAIPVSKNERDVNALNAIIAEQKALGATISEDLDSDDYIWSEEGRLIKICWEEKNVQGNLSLQELPKLLEFDCSYNQVTSLDVSHNTALTSLRCGGNPITSLDVSNNTALTILQCDGNQLMSLDVSNNTELTKLTCSNNQLTSLDVNNNTELTYLNCGANRLTSLDVSNNTALTDLSCAGNQLESLNVSNNIALTSLWCDSNHFTSLDISNNAALATLICDEGVTVTGGSESLQISRR